MTESEHTQAERMSEEGEQPHEGLETLLEMMKTLRTLIAQERVHQQEQQAQQVSASVIHGGVVIREAPSPISHAKSDARFYDEVRRAVGRGAPTVLLGTSTRSLKRSLAKLTAVEQGEPAPTPRVALETPATSGETKVSMTPSDRTPPSAASIRYRPPTWIYAVVFSVFFLLLVTFLIGVTNASWWSGLLVFLIPVFVIISTRVAVRLERSHYHRVYSSLYRFSVRQPEAAKQPDKPKKDKKAEHRSN